MKGCKEVFLTVFFVVLLVPLVAFASYTTQQYPNVTPIEKMHPNGKYIVYVEKGGNWQEAGSISFDMYFREREIDIKNYISNAGNIRVRLLQQGGGAAQIDSVTLGGKSPTEVRGIENGLKKLSDKDFDVIDAFNKSIEMTFPFNRDHMILKLTARVEAARIIKVPFQFPTANLYKEMSLKSKFYTYGIGTRKTDSPFFKEYSLSGSGHPSGYTYGWVSNDEKNLYVRIDFTPDDTMDGDKDYAKVYIKTAVGVKEFKVSVPETRWGNASFIYTDKVTYQHKVYDFTIPLNEIGIKDAKNADEIKLAFAAYGTAAPGHTCPYYYEALIDADNNPNTGGAVHVVQKGASADITGIDYRVIALLDGGTGEITSIAILTWNSNTSVFDTTSTPYDYSVGMGNGYQYNLEKAYVVEFMASKAALGNPQGNMKIVYHASVAATPVSDYTAAFYFPPLRSASVPTLTKWGILALSLLFGISAIWMIRKRKAAIGFLVVLAVVLSITGYAWAPPPPLIILDGQVTDWQDAGVSPSVTDPYGDSSTDNNWEDIVAGYITSDTNNIYFRIDIVGGKVIECPGPV
jgi:hypothetical protein